MRGRIAAVVVMIGICGKKAIPRSGGYGDNQAKRDSIARRRVEPRGAFPPLIEF